MGAGRQAVFLSNSAFNWTSFLFSIQDCIFVLCAFNLFAINVSASSCHTKKENLFVPSPPRSFYAVFSLITPSFSMLFLNTFLIHRNKILLLLIILYFNFVLFCGFHSIDMQQQHCRIPYEHWCKKFPHTMLHVKRVSWSLLPFCLLLTPLLLKNSFSLLLLLLPLLCWLSDSLSLAYKHFFSSSQLCIIFGLQ